MAGRPSNARQILLESNRIAQQVVFILQAAACNSLAGPQGTPPVPSALQLSQPDAANIANSWIRSPQLKSSARQMLLKSETKVQLTHSIHLPFTPPAPSHTM
jgi:hypothetical protein